MTILADAQEEASRIIAAAAARRLLLRLLGGLAIRCHAPSAVHRAFARDYPDLDFALASRRSDLAERLFADLDYEPNKTLNLLNGDRRLMFFDREHDRQVDVFVGGFHMCHPLPITERMSLEPLTLPLAELLLTKMQIVQMNEKDARDVCALLLDHPFGEADEEMFNLPVIARLCANDWGLGKTMHLSIQKVRDFCAACDLEPDRRQTILDRLGVLGRALDEAPKTLKWKTRAAIGERRPWYELPEEVRRGAAERR
jgi:hypothetical protein